MLQLKLFKIRAIYKNGKYIYLADILLRTNLNLATPSDPPEEVFHFNSEDTLQMFQVDLETLE